MRFGLHTPQTSTAGRNARRLGLVLSLVVGALLPAAEQSEPAPLAPKSLLLDLAKAGDRLVAVGDRGHVLLSTDQGATWTQVIVPTRAMLTAVAFPTANDGWAVGHDGVILATTDGGQTWQRRDNGQDLDTVFFDVGFVDAKRGYIVGAYGKVRFTADGGQTWIPLKAGEDELHFYRLTASPGGRLYLAGESGTVLASGDAGKTWSKLDIPYDGSFYGVLCLDEDNLLAYGLRGHIFRSADRGQTWEPVANPVTVLLMGATRAGDDAVVIGGLGGNLFVSRDRGATFRHWHPDDLGFGVAEVVAVGSDRIVVAGEGGVRALTLSR
jgi:photosystem II stability/assembly factor-like uncharacterized protein